MRYSTEKLAVRSGLLVIAASLILAVSCNAPKGDPPVPETLSVGMKRAEAEKRLDQAGASVAASDSLGPAAADALEDGAFYSLRRGALLEIGYRRASPNDEYTISELSVCEDPNVGKAARVFESVQRVQI